MTLIGVEQPAETRTYNSTSTTTLSIFVSTILPLLSSPCRSSLPSLTTPSSPISTACSTRPSPVVQVAAPSSARRTATARPVSSVQGKPHCILFQLYANRSLPSAFRVDVHEDKEKNLVTATFELPGINKQDVSIDVQNGRLTVSGESRFENEDRKENGYVLRERRFGRFSRSLPVPAGIKVRPSFAEYSSASHSRSCSQSEEIKAAMENGVLTVTFPRQTPEQLPKKITIA